MNKVPLKALTVYPRGDMAPVEEGQAEQKNVDEDMKPTEDNTLRVRRDEEPVTNIHLAKHKIPITASVVLFRERDDKVQVLIGRRRANPLKGAWSLPGGHKEKDEPIQDTAHRELKEETGLSVDPLLFVDRGWRYKDTEKERIDSVFVGVVSDEAVPEGTSDLADPQWMDLSSLPDLAFNHAEMIQRAYHLVFSKKLVADKGLEEPLHGKLIVFEGIDGSGKSTQVEQLIDWLQHWGYPTTFTEWNSSKLMRDAISKGKKDQVLTPMLFSLLHMADMVHRYHQDIAPALKANGIVVCDRYTFTSHVRDGLRGVPHELHNQVYSNLRKPDIVFHCKVDVPIAVTRAAQDKGLSYYSAGMDLGLADSEAESCLKYEGLMDAEYEKIFHDNPSVTRLDMKEPIEDIAAKVKQKVTQSLGIGEG